MGAEAARWLYIGAVAVYGLFVYYMLTRSIRESMPVRAFLWSWMASPVPMFFVAVVMERRDVWQLFNPEVQSWAFLFGDMLFLPFMAAMLARAWRHVDGARTAFVVWRLSCVVIGVAAGITFHVIDGVNYTELARNSPTKLLHDYGSYSVLFGALLYGLAALFVRLARKWALVSLLGFALWLGGGVADNTFHKLDGRNLHVQYDWEHMHALPY